MMLNCFRPKEIILSHAFPAMAVELVSYPLHWCCYSHNILPSIIGNGPADLGHNQDMSTTYEKLVIFM